ncbi:MAG: hypothetical protein ACRCZF_13975, partial [Gemmataceae bacterium]
MTRSNPFSKSLFRSAAANRKQRRAQEAQLSKAKVQTGLQFQQLEDRVTPFAGPNQLSTFIAPIPVDVANVTVGYSNFVQGASVKITSGFVPSEDRLLFTPQGNITGTYDTATGVLKLSGQASGFAYEAALNAVQYDNIAADPTNTARGLSIQLGTATYSPATGHYYQYIDFPSTPHTWTQARSDASSRNNLGLTGYMTTITSQAEQDFVTDISGNAHYTWIGGSDLATRNRWRWTTGPEGLQEGGSGRTFWSGGAVSGSYSNWYPGYPTFVSPPPPLVPFSPPPPPPHDVVAMLVPTGEWFNWHSELATDGYVVEFGGLGTTPSFADRWTGTITVLDATGTLSPSISGNTLTIADTGNKDNAITVSRSGSDLVFNSTTEQFDAGIGTLSNGGK